MQRHNLYVTVLSDFLFKDPSKNQQQGDEAKQR